MESAKMFIQLNLDALNNTGTNFRTLSILSDDENSCVVLEQSFYQYEIPENVFWKAGTYQINNGFEIHSYGCMVKFYSGSG